MPTKKDIPKNTSYEYLGMSFYVFKNIFPHYFPIKHASKREVALPSYLHFIIYFQM